MSAIAFTSTKWTLDVASRLVRANVRVHNADTITDDMAIVFVVNHFTRLETLLLPYVLHKHTGREIWSLAAAELFVGRIGSYLRSTGTVSTEDPDRDKTIINALLAGEYPWIIFPEGAMIKDKKVIDRAGLFRVYSHGKRRPPHTGAGVLALRTEFYRQKLRCIAKLPNQSCMDELGARFDLESVEDALAKRTVIVPVNITYFPMRAHDNVILRAAKALAGNLSARAIEELSVEGTVLSENTTIDIRLGNPIDVREYLEGSEFAELLVCGDDDLADLEADPESLFNDAARRLMTHYMFAIYNLTTVNYDHIFATLLRHMEPGRFTEQELRERAFLAARRIKALGPERVNHVLDETCRALIEGVPCPALEDFMQLAEHEGWVRKENGAWIRGSRHLAEEADFQTVRRKDLCRVIANEVEPLGIVTGVIRNVARLPRRALSEKVRSLLVNQALARFEDDYARYFVEGESKPSEVGRPFLLMPERVKGALLLIHGYLAAPREVRAMGDYFVERGFAVYGVRLKGHGTAPEDLAQTPWEGWYESVLRGLAIVRMISDKVVVGGFSMGGVLALLTAARKAEQIRAVFSVNAPVQLRNYAFRLAPSIVTINNLLKRVNMDKESWEFVGNDPENAEINYVRNPLSGVSELAQVMHAMEESLPEVTPPLLVLQGHRDPVVNPASGQLIFDKADTTLKELTVIDADHHGIINGEGAEHVFDRIERFLYWALEKGAESPPLPDTAPEPEPTSEAEARAEAPARSN